jgi:hypothetical protein
MKKELLAISGKLNSGKDTLAGFIIDAYSKKMSSKFKEKYPGPTFPNVKSFMPPVDIKKISFADPIKEMALLMFPQLIREDLWGPSQNKSKEINGYKSLTGEPLTRRDVLVDIGGLGRSYNVNCWGLATISKANNFRESCPVIITDCRFKSELKLIEAAGGKTIRIVRPGVKCVSTEQSEIDLDDMPLDKFNKVITNNSLENLIIEAGKIVDEYFEI